MSVYDDIFDRPEWEDRRLDDEAIYGKETPTPSLYGPGGFLESLRLRCMLTPKCESPIEIDLGAALIQNWGDRFLLDPQRVAGRFRYDFGVLFGDKLIALIECDGQEFHSTPKQLANDAAKDALAASLGVAMFRFTGKQIYRSPLAVAQSIIYDLESLVR